MLITKMKFCSEFFVAFCVTLMKRNATDDYHGFVRMVS